MYAEFRKRPRIQSLLFSVSLTLEEATSHQTQTLSRADIIVSKVPQKLTNGVPTAVGSAVNL